MYCVNYTQDLWKAFFIPFNCVCGALLPPLSPPVHSFLFQPVGPGSDGSSLILQHHMHPNSRLCWCAMSHTLHVQSSDKGWVSPLLDSDTACAIPPIYTIVIPLLLLALDAKEGCCWHRKVCHIYIHIHMSVVINLQGRKCVFCQNIEKTASEEARR